MLTADTVIERPGTAGRRRGGPVRDALRRAAPALAVYAVARLAGMVCVAVWCRHIGERASVRIGHSWDGVWYWRIAEYGYGTVMPSPFQQGEIFSDLAFFPLYPALIRGVAAALPFTGPVDAALLVSWVSAGCAAWGIYLVGERLHGRRAGFLLAVLWGVLPHAVIESMAYTEPLLTALAAWALYAVLERRWLWAGWLAVAAGLTRPSGIAVAAAVCVAAPAGEGRRRWTGAVIAPLGWLGYVLYVGWRTGRADGYFRVQRRWGSEYDFGRNAARFIRDTIVIGQSHLTQSMALAVVAVALVLFLCCVVGQQPVPLLAYSAVLLAITLGGTNFFQCKARFLLPAFPLLLPAAVALAGARRRTVVVLLVSLGAFSALYGTYLLTVCRFPP